MGSKCQPVGPGGRPGSPGWVGKPTWISVRGQESHSEVREGSVVPPGGPGGVERTTRRCVSHNRVEMPTRMSERGREATRRSGKGWDANPDIRKGSGDPPDGPGRIGKPTRRSGRGREAHPEVREGSEGSTRGPGGVGRPNRRCGRPSRRSGWGRNAKPKVPERSGGPPRGPGGVGSPTQRSRRGQ